MDLKRQLLDILTEQAQAVEEMRLADTKDDQAAFDAAKQKAEQLQAKAARLRTLIDAEEKEPLEAPKEPVDTVHNFCECVRAQARGDWATFRELRNDAMPGPNETTPSEGGLLVPQDIQTRINELKRTLNPLAPYFHEETVSFLSGTRVIDTNPTAGFTEVAEFGTIAQDDKPAFTQISYQVKKYALIVPVSNELLADSDQNIIAYLSGWFAKKLVITENKLLTALLANLDSAATAAAAGKELATLKSVLNTKLDPAISINSSFITNQDGFNVLDTLEDGMGRPLLQPDPTNGTSRMLLARPVHVVSNAVLPSDTTAPLYIGDFTQYGTLFRRASLELASSNIGGNAWTTDSTEIRGITRLDAEVFDSEAAVKVTLALS